MREWQLIETAPKDGTKIDVWRTEPPEPGGARYIDVSWRGGKWAWYYERDQEFIDLEEDDWKITHWMPMPAPPPA